MDEDKELQKYSSSRNNRCQKEEYGYCIRTGVKMPFDLQKPFSLEDYRFWATFENWNYNKNYSHKTGREFNGRTSMAQPILF